MALSEEHNTDATEEVDADSLTNFLNTIKQYTEHYMQLANDDSIPKEYLNLIHQNDQYLEHEDHNNADLDIMSSCNDDNCFSLANFISIMNKYNENYAEIATDLDESDLIDILNDYLHLMHQHEDQFEVIFNDLKYCDINKCVKYQRYYRNQIRSHSNSDSSKVNNVTFCLFDKMHCYFQHSYDVGHRLTSNELQDIDQITNESKYDDENVLNKYIFNDKLLEINKRIKLKRLENKRFHSNTNTVTVSKYNQLFEVTETKQEIHSKMYSFGHAFKYGYDGEKQYSNAMIKVFPKYESFKQELLEKYNNIETLNIDQYNQEYKKANIHLNSYFCKHNPSFQPYNDTNFQSGYSSTKWTLHLEYVLALMVYCNFDKLQYIFSKTYREHIEQRSEELIKNDINHENFYYWGKYLKIAVKQFGVKFGELSVSKFYHGVNQKMYLPRYSGINGQNGININGPLSTSSSYDVAVIFADNAGAILTFEEQGGSRASTGRCFPTAWLSDYSSEKECLFLQSGSAFCVSNIIEIDTGYEYKNVLKAAGLINTIMNAADEEQMMKDMNDSMRDLIKVFFEDKLLESTTISTHKPLSMTKLAKHIVDSGFDNVYEMEIDYYSFRKYAVDIMPFLLHTECEWINLKLIKILFPNVNSIIISNIKLNPKIFEYILQLTEISNSKLRLIQIEYISKSNEKLFTEIMQKYSLEYRKRGWFIYGSHDFENTVFIEQCNELEFIAQVMSMMNKIYFYDANSYIAQLIEKLTKSVIYGNYVNDVKQKEFSAYCAKQVFVEVIWNIFSSNKESYLFKLLLHSNIKNWIKIDVLIQLFPNIKTLQISGCDLNIMILDNIW
eukprot:456093_1